VFRRAAKPVLPEETQEFLTEFGLPKVVIFECDTPFEISFAPIATRLLSYAETINWSDDDDAVLYAKWENELIIADEQFCNGHASYCVNRATGGITRMDCELPQPETVVNSTIEQFAISLSALVKWSSSGKMLTTRKWQDSINKLKRELLRIDSVAFRKRRNHWRDLCAYIQSHEPDSFNVTYDPAHSKPRF
jgi:hypothetical protein